jgi:hypothetical protein
MGSRERTQSRVSLVGRLAKTPALNRQAFSATTVFSARMSNFQKEPDDKGELFPEQESNVANWGRDKHK